MDQRWFRDYMDRGSWWILVILVVLTVVARIALGGF